ncbi:AAA domain-containing protein, putative AbiEii toxin, Type IV TA system [Thiothrix eikelboomii]|uniref:AAA domain-containing protein, putative AbiEii toxin, Type IV TA system n=2 Tax=Thiothrix eikelboomii TaxID=92487 RepID=A0A1T4W2U4_9GAMM|nr:AAA domain-containing protein, putative AbiEii toxin, Type IV TA system [Thiothrix eikelboomii]
MLTYSIKIEGLKGVGSVELNLQENQRVYTLIGANGVGKTKTLEALFQVLLATNEAFANSQTSWGIALCFREIQHMPLPASLTANRIRDQLKAQFPSHHLPIVFLASQNRGFIQHDNKPAQAIGTLEQRRNAYFSRLVQGMNKNFTSLNMDTGIEEWFVTLAQSANPYQKQEDNRDIEIRVVLELLNKIDSRIDPKYMQISGDGRVNLKIDGQPRELSHLSTGFASILKMLQAIVSGYGYFTNETRLQQVKGIVLIDEIESHLHLSWQAKIIPLLKQLFPNTTFYITTHSSIVLSQLKAGEAYRLQRDTDGVVRTQAITSPNTTSLIDVLQEAFDIDLNRLKLDSLIPADQQQAKQQLLNLINGQGV